MYLPDERDHVVTMSMIPQPLAGAPNPVFAADEYSSVLVYYARSGAVKAESGLPARLPGGGEDERIAVVRFGSALLSMFGYPNDEVFAIHPLAKRGLEPYGTYLVEHSSWLRGLAAANAMHPEHNAGFFARLNHYIFTFHDSVFETIAGDLRAEETQGQLGRVAAEAARALFAEGSIGPGQSGRLGGRKEGWR